MKVVFVSAPYSAESETGKDMLQRICRFCVREGAIPVCPRLYYTQGCDFLNKCKYKEEYLRRVSEELITHCDEVWFFDAFTKSMKLDYMDAVMAGKPKQHFTHKEDEDCAD